MAKARLASWVLPLLALQFGCGPTRSHSVIVEASAESGAADTAQAAKVAPYEFVAATEYLKKAREEQSYSHFETSELLARKARDCAKLARLRAESSARSELGASEIALPKDLVCRPGPKHEGGAPPVVSPKKKKKTVKKVAPVQKKPAPVEPKDPTPPEGDEPLPAGEDPEPGDPKESAR